MDNLTHRGAKGPFHAAGWLLALGLVWSWFLLVFAPPLLPEGMAWVVHQGYALFCHQLPDRSPFIDGTQLAVCHRCIGIYAALALAVLTYGYLRRWDTRLNPRAGWILGLSVVPPGVDWLGGVFEIWSNTPTSRIFTGAVFGLAAGYFLARAFSDAFSTSGKEPTDATSAN